MTDFNRWRSLFSFLRGAPNHPVLPSLTPAEVAEIARTSLAPCPVCHGDLHHHALAEMDGGSEGTERLAKLDDLVHRHDWASILRLPALILLPPEVEAANDWISYTLIRCKTGRVGLVRVIYPSELVDHEFVEPVTLTGDDEAQLRDLKEYEWLLL